MSDILTVSKLKKTFVKRYNKVHALAGLNLTVKKGDYIAIQGPSGSGKTTLLNILGCLDKPTSGKLTIDGTEVSKMSERELSKVRGDKIGFIFQSFNLIPILNASENVELPLERTRMSKIERKERAQELLELVGLPDRTHHRPNELSAGEQQRVAIARALAHNPSIILADEPTGNLDSKTSRKIMDLLGRLNEEMGTTIIIVTHDSKMARYTKTQIYLKDGKISKTRGEGRGKSYDISEALNISAQMVKKLIQAGYDDLEKITQMTEANLKVIKKLKRRDVKHIMYRIEKYRSGSKS